jgi:NhaP-type Na+/H+ or K+/H+ antiporter
VIGVGSGIIWGEVITRLRDRPLNYMMTIAALFPLYLLADYLSGGGGGPIAVFLFGAVLMNYGYVTKSLGMNRRSRIDRRKIKEYHDEITFLIKAMFFVYLGLLVQFNLNFVAISVLITVLIVVVRYIIASLIGYIQGVPSGQVAYTRLFFIQGAGSLVLTQFVAKYDPAGLHLADPSAFASIVIPVVIFSIVFSSMIAPLVASKQVEVKPSETPVETEKEQTKPEKAENKNSKKDEKKST